MAGVAGEGGERTIAAGGLSVVRRVVVVLAVAAMCLVAPLGTLAGRVNLLFVADADSLLLHELIPDLLGDGAISRWTIPYSTYLLPDWPLYAAALAIGWTPAATVALFAFLQLGLAALSVRLLAGAVDRSSASLLAVTAVSVITMTTALNGFPVVYLLTSYVHAGTAILALATLALLMRWVAERGVPRHLLFASAAVTVGAVASDRLFLVWSLAPMGAAVVAAAAWRMLAPRSAAMWLLVHVVAVAVAWPVAGLIFPMRSEYGLVLGLRPRFGLERFLDTVREIHQFSPSLFPAVALCAAVSVVVLAVGRSVFGHRLRDDVRLVLLVYGGTLAVVTVGSQLAMVGPVPPHARYSTPLLLLPLAVAPLVSLAGIGASASRWRFALGVSSCLPVLAFGAVLLDDVEWNTSPVPAKCVMTALASSGSRHGIASYWDARPLQVYSDGHLVMSEFGPELRPHPQNANRREVRPRYDFAVVAKDSDPSDLREGDLIALAGVPVARVDCGPWNVLDYGPGGLSIVRSGQRAVGGSE